MFDQRQQIKLTGERDAEHQVRCVNLAEARAQFAKSAVDHNLAAGIQYLQLLEQFDFIGVELANLLLNFFQFLGAVLGVKPHVDEAAIHVDECCTKTARRIAGVEQDVRIESANVSIDDLEVLGLDVMNRLVVHRVQAANPHLEGEVAHQYRLVGEERWQHHGAVALQDIECVALHPVKDVTQHHALRLNERRRSVGHRLRDVRLAGTQQTQFLSDDGLRHLGI